MPQIIHFSLHFKHSLSCLLYLQMFSSYLQSLLQDFLSLGSSDSAVDCNLFISTDTKGSHSVAGWKKSTCSLCEINFTRTTKVTPHSEGTAGGLGTGVFLHREFQGIHQNLYHFRQIRQAVTDRPRVMLKIIHLIALKC